MMPDRNPQPSAVPRGNGGRVDTRQESPDPDRQALVRARLGFYLAASWLFSHGDPQVTRSLVPP